MYVVQDANQSAIAAAMFSGTCAVVSWAAAKPKSYKYKADRRKVFHGKGIDGGVKGSGSSALKQHSVHYRPTARHAKRPVR